MIPVLACVRVLALASVVADASAADRPSTFVAPNEQAGSAPSSSSDAGVLERARQVEQLIERGELAMAEARLAEQDFSPLLHATLQGRLELARGRPQLAERHFRAAVKMAPDHAPLRLLTAHALLEADEPAAVLSVLGHASLQRDDPAVALLRAAAHRQLGHAPKAYAALQRSAQAHPDHVGLRRELVMLCARDGLLQTARQWASTLTPAQLGSDVALVVLQQIRSDRRALSFAHWVAAGFPEDADVQAQLGWVASAAGDAADAARAFERAVLLGADLAYPAAEHYRTAGRHRKALQMNARVRQRDRRRQQRFDILFESGQMARAIVAADALDTSGGLSARRRYNLAYAHYRLRAFDEASRHARMLADTEEGQRARTLLAAMGR